MRNNQPRPNIRLHWSLWPIALLLTWELAGGALPTAAPGYPTRTYWLLAAVMTAALFCSLLAHEVGHALLAQRHGQRVRGITLWLFGGLAELEDEATGPGAELRVAVIGPAVSLAVAGLAGGVFWLLRGAGTGRLLVVAVGWLAMSNLLIAGFNLLPAFPLDGGRVLRAALWRWSGDRERATGWAADAGRVLGAGLIVVGAAGLLLSGWGLNGAWLAVLGGFVVAAATAQRRAVALALTVRHRSAGELVARPPVVAPDHLSVAEVVDRCLGPHQLTVCPLTDAGGRLTGLLTRDEVRRLPAAAWPGTAADRIARPVTAAVICQLAEPMSAVLRRLVGAAVPAVLVFDGTRLVGVLAGPDLIGPAR